MPPHLELLNRKLLAVSDGQISRLLIAMPPRHGKSEFASKYFPAWYLGTHPDRRVILASYEADFAMTWGRKVRDVLQEHGGPYFGVGVRRDSTAANRWSIADNTGGMDTAGVGGPITGKGAHLLIIDDPVKNAEEANSPTYRARAWDWYTSTAYTRLEPGGSVLLIQTRWHEDDLAGRIIGKAKEDGEPWDVLNLPALAGDGDALERQAGGALWPERYDAAALATIKRTIGSYFFAALYQQSPQPAEGGCFKRAWFRTWKPEGNGEFYRLGEKLVKAADCRRFGTVDLAFSTKKEADFTVILAWAVTPDCDLILLDMVRDRMEGPALVPAIRRVSDLHSLAFVGIEDVAAQTLAVQAARQSGLAVKGLKADKDKVTRAIPATVRMEAGQIYLPELPPWRAEVEAELLGFPHGSHDDIVDCIAYAAIEVQQPGAIKFF